MTAQPSPTAYYTDARGAGCVRQVKTADDARALLSKSSTHECRIENAAGDVIGGKEYRPGCADDRRIKWFWWYDAEEFQS